MPAHGDVRAVTVPGCVDGWVALHERYGRLALADVLEPARRLADGGFAASPQLARAPPPSCRPSTSCARPRTARARSCAGRASRAPSRRSPATGATGSTPARSATALLALGDGEFAADDLERPGADWVPPLGLRVWGRQGWTVPPNSQGYLTLGERLDRGGARAVRAGRRALGARADRGRRRRAQRPRPAAPRRRRRARAAGGAAARRAAGAGIDPAHASDPVRLRGDGGTVGIAAVDPDGMGVALIQSNYDSWGSGLFAEGIALHNRGAAFSLAEGTLPEYGPGRRPPHTLSPLLVCRPDGSLHTVLATMGGQAQPQILLQLLARRLKAGEAPADALAAGRWTLDGDAVAVEAHAPSDWWVGLPARGHRVRRRPSWSDDFGHAHLIAVEDDHLAAAADPRTGSGSASGF